MLNTKHCQLKQLIYCYNNASFIIAFLSAKDNFLRCKVHSVRHTYLFKFYLSKIIFKKPEVNSEPTYFLTFMNNGKAFPSFDSMTYSYSALTNFSFYQGIDKPKSIGFL